MNSKKTHRIGELFCGAGGIGLGALSAQYEGDTFEHVWAIDIDEDACRTRHMNASKYPCGNVLCADVRAVNFASLGAIDGLIGGIPCNDFSQAGSHTGIEGKYGMLFLEFARALKTCRPKWFLVENVQGLFSANGGKAFEAWRKVFGECGYRVSHKLIDFSDLGVPQVRKRVVIVGIRTDLPVDDPCLSFPVCADKRTAYSALMVPPIPSDAKNNEHPKTSKAVAERLSYIPAGGNAYAPTVPAHLRLHTRVCRSNCYKRLDPNRPSCTVVASSGGGNALYHWSENRALSPRELARLQSFPDDYEFYGNYASVKRQIGMAVPPVGISVVLVEVLKAFHDMDGLTWRA